MNSSNCRPVYSFFKFSGIFQITPINPSQFPEIHPVYGIGNHPLGFHYSCEAPHNGPAFAPEK